MSEELKKQEGHGHHHDHQHNHQEHDHGEECSCHDRHHGHQQERDEFPSVSVYTHDIAVVGSVKCKIDGQYEDALDKLQGCMEEAAKAVEAAGGMIGHMKAFAKEEARSCVISITEGADIQRKLAVESGIHVENVNIVFGVTPDHLEEILRRAFEV